MHIEHALENNHDHDHQHHHHHHHHNHSQHHHLTTLVLTAAPKSMTEAKPQAAAISLWNTTSYG